ncbi:hypothetical protein C772_01507 [Bhargavaea cecembensis DSE10]|uniref:Heme exporter protein D n=1 Tax=Bhargavaea cecembensis DSE10 TaxID=1235279 RepID=M7NH86_9BACL|nr:hypothetical protein [Bhargavaea cecembensis]EMR06612.1 hypothetical protein C772_01507 [Bhargavaea cecembensis DSE10]
MSLETFSFFYYFVFIWGGAGMLFIAVVLIREMLQMGKKADDMEAELSKAKAIGSEESTI